MDWIELALYRVRRRAFVNTATILHVLSWRNIFDRLKDV